MARKKKDEPTWSDVKSVLTGFDHKKLVELAGDLYRLSKENKDFIHARFSVGQDRLVPYKKTIEECMYPNVLRDKPIQISKAKRAVSSYSKAVADPIGEAELMTFFVECGNSFTVEYGDIDEDFYNALNLMYKRAIEKVSSLPTGQRGEFRDRLEEIMTSSSGIGWGTTTNSGTISTKLFPRMNSSDLSGRNRCAAVPSIAGCFRYHLSR